MIESKYTVEQFRSVALNTFGFLESGGVGARNK